MDEQEVRWRRQFEAHRGHLRAVAYRMLGSLGEADDAVQEAWLRLQPHRRRRDREPRRLADHGRRADLPRHAALAAVAARGAARRARARADRGRADGDRPRARGAAGRRGRAGAAGGARHADPGRAARVRAARHVRRALRRDRADRRALTGRRPPAREPRPPPGAGAPRRRPTPTWPASARSSTPSSPPPAAATSTPWSRCSTPTWSGGPTATASRYRAPPGLSAERPTWRAERSPSRASTSRCGRRS